MANRQAFCDPYVTGRSNENSVGGLTNLGARHTLGALAQPSTGNTYGFLSGVFPGGTAGEGMSNDLAGYAAGGMKTAAYAGGYACDRGSLGVYLGAALAPNEAALPDAALSGHGPSNPSNPRIDLVVVRNRDPKVDSGVTESAKLVILQGTPAASPSRPDNLLTNGDVPLYSATVRAGASAIVDTDIADLRRFVVARGGIYPAAPGDTRPGAYEGQYRDNVQFNQLERWSGLAWEATATPAVWAGFAPRLYAAGSATDVALGKGGQYLGRCQLLGRTLHFLFHFVWGAAPWNGGYGDISTFLPRHPILDTQLYGTTYPQWVQAHLTTKTAQFAGDFHGQALITPSSTKVVPYFAKCHGHFPPDHRVDMNTAPYKIADGQGKAASGVPAIFNPDGYPEGGSLSISGTCEVTW